MNAGDRFVIKPDIVIEAIPAAHEKISMNAHGEHHFWGYLLRLGDVTLYHSGDCVPYPGLESCLLKSGIDEALLPVNGRDEYRSSRGIAGNFTPAEAVSLSKAAHIPVLLCHHFGMFDFNTLHLEDAERALQNLRGAQRYFLVKPGIGYCVSMPPTQEYYEQEYLTFEHFYKTFEH